MGAAIVVPVCEFRLACNFCYVSHLHTRAIFILPDPFIPCMSLILPWMRNSGNWRIFIVPMKIIIIWMKMLNAARDVLSTRRDEAVFPNTDAAVER